MPKNKKKTPKDINQLAAYIVEKSTDSAPVPLNPKKDQQHQKS